MLSLIGGFKKVKFKFVFFILNYLIKLIKILFTVIYYICILFVLVIVKNINGREGSLILVRSLCLLWVLIKRIRL